MDHGTKITDCCHPVPSLPAAAKVELALLPGARASPTGLKAMLLSIHVLLRKCWLMGLQEY